MSASNLAGFTSPTVAEILTKLGSDPKTGLNSVQLQERLTKYGPNALGLLGVIQSFGLLDLGDTLHHLDHPQLRTMMFLQLVAGGHLMLFVTRTRGALWKPPYPNIRLFFAIVVTQIIAVFMCSQGWLVPPLSWRIIGLVWAYNLVWMIVQDVVKLGLYGVLDPARSWKRSIFQSLRVPMTRGPEAIS
jgi:H+-transporting ATPase